MNECKWLPPLITWENEETFDDYLFKALGKYKNYYNVDCFYFSNKEVSIRKFPYVGIYPNEFWHICGEETSQGVREPKEERISHVLWVREIIRNVNCAENCCSDKPKYWTKVFDKNGMLRHKIFFRGYLVILEERPEYFLLVTAYPVTNKWNIQRLNEEYKKQNAAQT